MAQPHTIEAEVTKLYNELLGLTGDQTTEVRRIEWQLRKLKRPGGPLAVDVALMQALAQRGAIEDAVDISRNLRGAIPAMGPDELWTYSWMSNGLLLVEEALTGMEWCDHFRLFSDDVERARAAAACFAGINLHGAPWLDRFTDIGIADLYPDMMQIVREELIGLVAFCTTEVIDADEDLGDEELPGLSIIGHMPGDTGDRRQIERRVHNRLASLYENAGVDVVEASMAFHVTLLPIEAYRCLKKT